MTKLRGGRGVEPANPSRDNHPARTKNRFAALAMDDSSESSGSAQSSRSPSPFAPPPPPKPSVTAAPQPNETVEELRSRWSQIPHRPPSEFPTLFARGKSLPHNTPASLKLDLTRPLFQDDTPASASASARAPITTGGPYSPKTPPYYGSDMCSPTIETIEQSYPYAQCTPPNACCQAAASHTGEAHQPPPLTLEQQPPTITMAMRIKETLDTVSANRAAAAINQEERVNKIKKSLEGISFFRRGL